MKQMNFFFSINILFFFLLSSCTKTKFGAETKFEPTATSLQVVDPQPIVANEKDVFPVIASTNGTPFVKFSVEHLTNFEGFFNETKVLVPDDITMDGEGNFSRPSKTIVLEYPVIANMGTGSLLTVKFTFTNKDGKSVSTEANKVVVNFRANTTKKYFYATTPWYNFNTGLSYSKATVGTGTEEVKANLDIYWVNKTPVHWMVSPNSNLAAESLATTPGYDRSTAHHTQFIKIEGVAFSDIDDAFLEGMDFTNSVDEIELVDKGLYGVLLHDGRKAVVYSTAYSATVDQIVSVYQVTP